MGDGDEVAGVGVDVGLVEGAVGVLGLNDAGEATEPSSLTKYSRVGSCSFVGVELVLDGGEDFGPLERGSRRGDGGWRKGGTRDRVEEMTGLKRTTEKESVSETAEAR